MTAATDTAIEARHLGKRFGAIVAAADITFAVSRGEIFGLVGPDGAGKTTIMRMLAAVMQPDAGSISVDGIDAVADPERAKRRISYMPQRFGLYEDLTVEENIRFYADLFDIPRALRRERARRLLAASGMGEFRRRLAGQLSGGMKQKLGLACALVHTPRILLLDEPTTGVDPVSRREFWQLLYELGEEGVAIVISTAYLDEAERCHRLALLHQGRVRYCDTPEALKRRMPGALVAITAADPRAVRSALRGAAGVASAMLVGDGLHVAVDDAARRIPELKAALAAAGIGFDEMAAVSPAIEDLFVTLLEGERAP